MQRSDLQSLTEAYNEVILIKNVAMLIEQGKTKEEIKQILNEGLFSSIGKGLKDFGNAAGITPTNLGKKFGEYLGTTTPTKTPSAVPNKKAKTPPTTISSTTTPPKSKVLADHMDVVDEIAKFISTNTNNPKQKSPAWKNAMITYLKNAGYK